MLLQLADSNVNFQIKFNKIDNKSEIKLDLLLFLGVSEKLLMDSFTRETNL